ncbi:MotE family protein [Asticcacaulis solisilvae]|uniref:MotE family protein n=1 Tax=Asticcacaulis solisilvae TaxID=1217274 RepID=UPI003FD7C094
MANLPRLLPIISVAVGGVLAMKAITSMNVLPDVFHAATAFAADSKKAGDTPKARPVAKKAAKGAGGEVSKEDDPTESYAVDPSLLNAADASSSAKPAAAEAATPQPPVCATSVKDLAAQAGISPNELNILQSLGQRRAELDQREQGLNSREQLIQAADDKLDARINQLQGLKTQIQGLLDQANKTSADDTVRMVKVYESMKPKDAAAVLTTMSDEVRLPIAAGMKDRALAAILGAMTPDAARDLTEKLTSRMKGTSNMQQQLDKMTANGSTASSAPATPAAPAKGAAKPAKPTAAAAPAAGKAKA